MPEPKTKMRTARHQAAKLEAVDLLELADIAFGDLGPSSRLWPYSAQTLRKRLDTVLERLGVPTARTHRKPCYLPRATVRGHRAGSKAREVGLRQGHGDLPSTGRGLHFSLRCPLGRCRPPCLFPAVWRRQPRGPGTASPRGRGTTFGRHKLPFAPVSRILGLFWAMVGTCAICTKGCAEHSCSLPFFLAIGRIFPDLIWRAVQKDFHPQQTTTATRAFDLQERECLLSLWLKIFHPTLPML